MDKEVLIKAYKELKLKLGKEPSSKEFYKNTEFTYHDVSKVFPINPYSSLVKECGDSPKVFGTEKYDTDQILINYGKLVRKLQKAPTSAEWKFYDMKPNISSLKRNHRIVWSELSQLFRDKFISDSTWFDVIEILPVKEVKDTNENELINLVESECFVYLMLDKRNGLYKIGISSEPKYREKTLQSEQPKVGLVAKKKYINRKIAGAIEKALHNVYHHKHQRGEWFRLDEEDLNELKHTLAD